MSDANQIDGSSWQPETPEDCAQLEHFQQWLRSKLAPQLEQTCVVVFATGDVAVVDSEKFDQVIGR